MQNNRGTQLVVLLPDLDGNAFEQKLDAVLSQVALAVRDLGKKGQVSVNFDMTRIGESNQITLSHQIKYTQPTERGKRIEEDRTETPLYVSNHGQMTPFPESASDMFGEQNKQQRHKSTV